MPVAFSAAVHAFDCRLRVEGVLCRCTAEPRASSVCKGRGGEGRGGVGWGGEGRVGQGRAGGGGGKGRGGAGRGGEGGGLTCFCIVLMHIWYD